MADTLYIRAHKAWGKDEFVMLMEECGELIQQASKMYRGKGNIVDLAGEIADVEIMLTQMKHVFADDGLGEMVAAVKGAKIERLRKRVDAAEAKTDTRPQVVCLCGSTRFMDQFRAANLRLTLEGKIVLSIGCDTKSDDALELDKDVKRMLDELHKRKIDTADSILVLNVNGYIGESTRSEIEYAEARNIPIDYLENTVKE